MLSSRGSAFFATVEVVQDSLSETGKSFLSALVTPPEEVLEVAVAAALEVLVEGGEELEECVEVWVEVAAEETSVVEEDSSTLVVATLVLLLTGATDVVETAVLVATEEASVEDARAVEEDVRALQVDLRWRVCILRPCAGAAETETSEKARRATRVLSAYMAARS